jgi:hypothetical protein
MWTSPYRLPGGSARMMLRVLERTFVAKTSAEQAWAHLENVEQWPSWARHIRRITLNPRGPLRENSEGVIYLTNGLRSTFRMEAINPITNWRWGGSFLWLAVHYDHRFEPMSNEGSKITFTIDVEGVGAAIFGRVFAAIYAVSLDRAIPILVRELESGEIRR